MKNLKMIDWIPTIGLLTAVYNNAKAPNGFIMLVWFLYQFFILPILYYKIILL